MVVVLVVVVVVVVLVAMVVVVVVLVVVVAATAAAAAAVDRSTRNTSISYRVASAFIRCDSMLTLCLISAIFCRWVFLICCIAKLCVFSSSSSLWFGAVR